ncbi:restriction endonuclease subunit S [Streptomyces erythrogriseus]|uniref:Type I restriction-modification system specificity subunit n=1 Tax=Streptomyces erythrogriseus TaxID=284027 RepID=A0ABP6JJD9_9ACTN
MSQGSDGPWELPKGWEWAPFADVARVASNLVSPFDYPDLPHIAPNHIESETGRLLPFSTVAEDGVKSPKHLFTSGHILYSKIRPYLAKVVMVKFDGLCSADMYPIATELDPGYLTLWLRSPAFTGLAAKHQGRSVLPKINKEALVKLPVPVPPLAEQQRIVVALDEQLSRLSAGAQSLGGTMGKADALRRKVLARLTKAPGDSWTQYQLGDLAASVRNGMYVSRPGVEPDGVAILRIGAVRPLRLELTDLRYSAVEEQQVAEDGYLLEGGDLLFTRYNGNPAYVGACAVVPEGAGPLTYPDKLIRVQLRRDIADAEFVAMACTGGSARQVIASAVKTTAGQAGIAGRDLKKVPISLPSLEEQRHRVRVYQSWEAVIARLETEVSKGQRRVGQLRRSLLAEAFAGRLVPQDPAEEPAEELLTRIRAEREAAGATTPRRRSPRRAPAQRKRASDTALTSDAPPPPGADAPAFAAATQPTLDLEIPS